MLPKVPRIPPEPLEFEDKDFTWWDSGLYRIHRVRGEFPLRWNQMRNYGPLRAFRWDHHPEPTNSYPGHRILYAANNYETCFAEVFQGTRYIPISDSYALSGWFPVRPLRLLNLTSNWPIRNRAGRALTHAPRPTCRAWAREIAVQAPVGVDGLITDSTLVGHDSRSIVLWQGAENSFPSAPTVSLALNAPELSAIVQDAAQKLGYGVA